MYRIHNVYRPLYGYAYGQITGEGTGALAGKRIAGSTAERSLGVEYYTYGQHKTLEQAQDVLAGGIEQAAARGWTVYDQGIDTLSNGMYQPWLKLIPPLQDPTGGGGATLTKDVGPKIEEKTFPWGWVALGVGGVLAVGIIAAVVMSKKGK